MTDPFYENSYKLCKSIISQRLILLKIGKSKINDIEYIKMATEELNIEFEKYKSNKRTIAFFIKKYYDKLVTIVPHSKGWEIRVNRLSELYTQAIQIK